MPDMLHSGERLLLWPWERSRVECSKSEQQNNAEYILANKKLPPKSAFLSSFFLLTFQLDWLKIVENRSAAVCQLTLFALAANLRVRSS